MSKVKTETVTYEMAEPATRIEVIKWLISGGRFGRLYVSKSRKFIRYSAPPTGINCRCTVVDLNNN